MISRIPTETEILEFFTSDEKLMKFGLSDSELADFCPDSHSNYVALGEGPLALFKWEPFTDISCICHMYVSSKLWGSPIVDDIEEAVEQWLIDNTNYLKMLLTIPEKCTNVIRRAAKSGFEIEGASPSACLWRGEICGMILMGKTLNRSNMRQNNG